ncbi:hypothetical protein LMTR3_17245 [Bradyrhizobium sp. LMTR 3]|nr:hypothetical protein LMTR3_17245 [Bradyrhizobium sp. LMTR 3]
MVSVFNIGYFSNIGLHFLGLIDLTNIVYSIGLVFGGLILVANVLGAVIDILIKLAREAKAIGNLRRNLRLFFGILALAATILVGLPTPYRPDFFTAEAYFSVLFSLLFIWALIKILLRYKSSGDIKFSEIMLGIIALVSADLSAGKAVAEQQISQPKQLYTFLTKSGVVYGVNLIRSSSSGFIVANDHVISFLSKDEVKAIRSERSVTDMKKR